MKNLKKKFLKKCLNSKFEINKTQIEIIDLLSKFYTNCFKKNFFSYIFNQKSKKIGFYLSGDVGVGKTMILDFFYKNLEIPKQRVHFNEFMINFHNFVHKYKKKNKNSLVELFAKNIKKKTEIIYFDEFQVTNIVDAMILGKLFENMFKENIKIIVTSNIEIDKLYKDGLQREQFIPFINMMKKMCHEKKLIIKEDYRKSKSNILNRFLYPLNEETNFKINQIFRKITKNKECCNKKLKIKGRIFEIKQYFEKIARFSFNELCNQNIGAEDYIKISEICNFIVLENIPEFNDKNSDKQQRFITLIDILYEKKIPIMTSSMTNIENFGSSRLLVSPFKRTLSRLYELTSIKIDN